MKSTGLNHLARRSVSHLRSALRMGDARSDTDAPPKPDEEVLAPLDARFRAPLLSMYRGEPQPGNDGQSHAIDHITKVSAPRGMWLYDLCVSVKPLTTLEIGMAYGYSTIYILAAQAVNGSGHHTAIDPYQSTSWHGIGLTHARALAPEQASGSGFRLIEDRSDRASAELTRSNATFDVIFIDGDHKFDGVLVDFFLYAQVCAIGGHIIFDDMWMSSIQTVVAFVRANRPDFVEVSTGEPSFAVFRKVDHDTRDWRHFRAFTVSSSSD